MNRRRLWAAVVVLLIASLLLRGAWVHTRSVAQQNFESDIVKVKQAFYEGVKAADSAVQALQSFCSVTNTLNEDSFGRFATDIMRKNPFIVSASFYAHVTRDERRPFESALASSGRGKRIQEGGCGEQPEVVDAKDRTEYFPLFATDTDARDLSYFGWDVTSDPSKKPAVLRSVATRSPQSTGTFLLDSGHVAVEIFSPVGLVATNSGAAPKGVVSVVVDLTKLLGDEQWREGVGIVLSVVLEGESQRKDIFRQVDHGAEGHFALDTLDSDLSIDRFGQRLGLRFSQVLTMGRIHPGALVLTVTCSTILALLAWRLLRTYEQLQDTLRGLEDANARLENRVAERTKELARAHAEIKEVLDNLDDIVFSVAPDLSIGSTYSPASHRLLGTTDLVNRNVRNVLFKDLSPAEEQDGRHLFALGTFDAANELQWEMSAPELLPTVNYLLPSGNGEGEHAPPERRRTFSVRYSPIFEDGWLKRVVVVASDVTEILSLRASLATTEKLASLRADALVEVASGDRASLPRFFREAEPRVAALRELSDGPAPDVATLLRELHTLKGGGRSIGLKALARRIHSCEDVLEPLRARLNAADGVDGNDQGSLLPEYKAAVADAVATVEEYLAVYADLFGSSVARHGGGRELELLESALGCRLNTIDNVAALARDLRGGAITDPQDILHGFFRATQEVAERLHKAVEFPKVAESALLDARLQGPLFEALTHATRNAVDHGIEEREQRAGLGKPEAGHIWIECALVGNVLELRIRDDGRGIDVEKVFAAAARKGLVVAPRETMSESAILELLFLPGFSTRDEISELSGRGVGLDAVRTACRVAGVECRVNTEVGKGSQFVLAIPRELVRYEIRGDGRLVVS